VTHARNIYLKTELYQLLPDLCFSCSFAWSN